MIFQATPAMLSYWCMCTQELFPVVLGKHRMLEIKPGWAVQGPTRCTTELALLQSLKFQFNIKLQTHCSSETDTKANV